jgi:hypothetical protein
LLADAPESPDFDNEYFRTAHPHENDISDLVPVIANTRGDSANKTVDVFFVHSAGFVGPGSWNSNMQSENSEAQLIEYMLSSVASIFNDCCNSICTALSRSSNSVICPKILMRVSKH